MHPLLRRGLGGAIAATAVLGVITAAPAAAYQPTPGDLFVANSPDSCNKRPCVLYPKAAVLPSGRLVATFEDSESAVVGQTLPIFKSDDDGATWQKLAAVKPPAQLSNDPAVAKYTSNWTNAYLYTLPTDVGALKAGTLTLATVVSGDDEYAKEKKAADPNWKPDGDGDRRDLAIALYSSVDQGASWTFTNIITTGGWQGGSAGRIGGAISKANAYAQVDPVWEPHLVATGGKLVAFYSDENDYTGYDPTTLEPILDPANGTAQDSGGQILAHRTWDGWSTSWSKAVVDVAGLTQDVSGKKEIGGGRPGMATIAPTTDGKWLMTYEYFGGGAGVRIKSSADPLSWRPDDTGQTAPGVNGGSPVLLTMPDGRIVYNDADSGNVFVNESGSSTGAWKEFQTGMPAGYSRNLTYVPNTGRVLILQAGWAGDSIGPVAFGEVDLGRSKGTYYTLVNRQTGQVLSPTDGRTNDAKFTGDKPDITTSTRDDSIAAQYWHVVRKGSAVTFLNKGGGRALAIWQGRASAGASLAQWVDDDAADKRWNLVATKDGYYTVASSQDSSLLLTGSSSGGASLQASGGGAAQEWQLVADLKTTATSEFKLVNRGSGAVLGVQGGSGADLAPVVQWTDTNAPDQRWRFVDSGSGTGRITNLASGKVLGIEGASTAQGARAVQFSANGSTDQDWSLALNGGYYTIRNTRSGLLLGVQGGSTAAGAPVVQWTADSSTNQQWQLVKTSGF